MDVPVKVVGERLGHANVAFTIHTYQHLLPGMSAAAASSSPPSSPPTPGRRLPAPPERIPRSGGWTWPSR
ncbi:MAG: hypothetical protein R2701_09625 [Acidimicrobiales bacterium]